MQAYEIALRGVVHRTAQNICRHGSAENSLLEYLLFRTICFYKRLTRVEMIFHLSASEEHLVAMEAISEYLCG